MLFTGLWALIAYFRAEVRRRQDDARRLASWLCTLSAVTERTLVLIKPDGVQRQLVGEIIGRIERKGLTLVALELRHVSQDLAAQHYAEHEGKPFFASLLEFITSGPVVAAIVEGPRAIAAFRQLAGGTDPVEKAIPGTIRGDFGLETQFNLVHGSDSVESAKREIRALVSRRLELRRCRRLPGAGGSARAGGLRCGWTGAVMWDTDLG